MRGASEQSEVTFNTGNNMKTQIMPEHELKAMVRLTACDESPLARRCAGSMVVIQIELMHRELERLRALIAAERKGAELVAEVLT